jgi:hypothetical protein
MIIETPSGIILPGHPFFDEYLYGTLPPGWRNFAYHNSEFAFVGRAGSGILEAVSESEFEEYIEGGEYDKRLKEMGESTDDFED